ncbi:hypothetical protein [uncultured Vagococcus sp.]|uniref:hypothetical protein n=1 Tax=uncultured Vagococcus sp. TaxID=189676 RepID=UPI0028D445DA|nr:hypothetical protein [uncultured Vagococcus sp.]
MRIGILIKRNTYQQIEKIGECDTVIILDEDLLTKESFKTIIKENLANELVISELGVIPLRLIQLLPAFRLLVEHQQRLTFIKKDDHRKLSDQEYFDELYQMALFEERVMQIRTKIGIKKAREEGISIGRPPIKNERAQRIQHLYQNEKKTIREIAELCQVSVGTAYKYATQDVESAS